jgi:hypothetical protein
MIQNGIACAMWQWRYQWLVYRPKDLWNMGNMLKVILLSSLTSDCRFSLKYIKHVHSLTHDLVPGNFCDKFMFVRMSYWYINLMFTLQVVILSCSDSENRKVLMCTEFICQNESACTCPAYSHILWHNYCIFCQLLIKFTQFLPLIHKDHIQSKRKNKCITCKQLSFIWNIDLKVAVIMLNGFV